MLHRPTLRIVLLGLLSATAAPAWAQFGGGPRPATDLRLDLGQMYSLDDVTDRHLSFSELRGSIDGRREVAGGRLELHVDGRGRYAWTDVSSNRVDFARLNLSFGAADAGWTVAVGRMSVDAVGSARVDGASVDLRLIPELHLIAFGGLMPHPLDGAPNVDFLSFGVGYDARTESLEHSGGLAINLYQGGLDRFYATERFFWRIAKEWQLHGFLILDFVGVSGLLGDIALLPPDQQSALEKIDVTSADLTLRFFPSRSFDVALSGSPNHTLLPNLWWTDFIAEERARRGFVLDGPQPVGTRRTNARVVMNFHLTPAVTPYLRARFDARFEDGKKGYEGAVGLKLDDVDLGYIDVSASVRSLFGNENELVGLAMGTSFANALGLDLTVNGLRVVAAAPATGPAPEPELLLDVGASAWLDLKAVSPALGDVRVMATYQAFIASDMIFQAGFARIGYRFREL